MIGSEPAGIGCVDRDGKAALGEEAAGGFEDCGAQAAPWQSPSTMSAPFGPQPTPAADGIEWQSISR